MMMLGGEKFIAARKMLLQSLSHEVMPPGFSKILGFALQWPLRYLMPDFRTSSV
jgi:hypothetical protein